MAIQDRQFLVDTYNLRLKQGSGIKTYGLTLIDAIRRLGGRVSLLGDRRVARSREAALNEVMFFDVNEHKEGRVRQFARHAARAARTMVASLSPTEVKREHVIPDDSIRSVGDVQRLYNIGQVYESANQSYKRFGTVTTVKLKEHIDVWHATTFLPIRVRGARTVTTVHDVIPLRLPYTTLDNKRFFYRLAQDMLRESDLVLAVSECTKRDLLALFPVQAEKIAVTYQSVTFKPYVRDERREKAVLERHRLKAGEYILFVGNIEPKKNLAALIDASVGVSTRLPLVVVGRKAWLYEEQLAHAEAMFGSGSRRKKWLHLLDYVTKTDLSVLYANAACLVFPSLYEGFGLPPLEAFAHDCPVICSNVSSLPEVCGDAALYVDPYEPDTIRSRLDELLGSAESRQRLIEAGREQLRYFSPERYAERLARAYDSILR